MKVYIGPYPTRLVCNLHTNYMHKKYGPYEWDGNTTKFESFLELLEDSIQSIYNIINKPYYDKLTPKQSITIHDYDLWSMGHTLAKIIHPMLIKLKADKHGSPFVDLDDVPSELHPTNPDTSVGVDDTHHTRWDWVLDEMIWAFEQHSIDWESKFYNDDNVDFEHTFTLRQAHQKRMDNGVRLFAKYYNSLWD